MPFRIAMLALALAAAGAASAQTGAGDPRSADAELDRTVVEADVIEGVSDLEVTARGNAEINRDDLSIFGDVLRYNRELGRAEGDGGVRLRRGSDRFFGPRLYYNTFDDTGVFETPEYLLQGDRTARGSAERLEFLGRGRYRMTNATYTTCQPGQEDWRLEAKELDLDFEGEDGEAVTPRLRFFDTTILASPWATFPLGDRRRPQAEGLPSPILTPWGPARACDDAHLTPARMGPSHGAPIPHNLPGVLEVAEEGKRDCRIIAGDVLAWCAIGSGRAVVLADAALLDLHQPHPTAASALNWLIAVSFAETGDGTGRDGERG